MKIAIFHDYFDEIGGAEITLLHLARGLNATILTTNIDRKKIDLLGFKDVKMMSIGRVTQTKRLKQILTAMKFFFLSKKDYDFFIFGGSLSIYASQRNKPNIWLCFSPQRGLYDLRYQNVSKGNTLVQSIKSLQIYFDKKYAKSFKTILAPSRNIQERIKKYYNRESKVIHHLIENKGFYNKPNKNYWLALSRIDPYKRIELQIEAFSKIKDQRLFIVGGPAEENKYYFDKLKRNSPKNITFLGPIFDKKKLSALYSECKGFITTSKDEDFGMTPIEAMASGKPVIAPNEGGYKETILNNKTGILIDNLDAEKLAKAITSMSKQLKDKRVQLRYKKACQQQAKKFDVKIFIDKIKNEIEEAVKQDV